MHRKTRVLLCEGHGPLRAALKALLNASDHICVVGEARNSEEALLIAAALAPDVVVVDMDASYSAAFQITQNIVHSFPKCGVILTSLNYLPCSRSAVLQSGAKGYILKSALATDLVPAILSASKSEASALHLTSVRAGASGGRR